MSRSYREMNQHSQSPMELYLVGRRFAHQRFANARESISKKKPIFEAIGQIGANRVLSPIRIQIRVIRVRSSLLSIFGKLDSQKSGFSEARIDSQRIFAIRTQSIRAGAFGIPEPQKLLVPVSPPLRSDGVPLELVVNFK